MARTFSHFCEVDLSDVLADLTTAELVDELKERRSRALRTFITIDEEEAQASFRDLLTELRRAFDASDGMHFAVLLMRFETLWQDLCDSKAMAVADA